MNNETTFIASEDDFNEFQRLTNTPMDTPKLDSLLREDSPFISKDN